MNIRLNTLNLGTYKKNLKRGQGKDMNLMQPFKSSMKLSLKRNNSNQMK